jgi:hypothetical protein
VKRKLTYCIIAGAVYAALGLLGARAQQFGQSAYPTALDTGATLPLSVNNASTIVGRQVNPADTVIVVGANSGTALFPSAGVLTIGPANSFAGEIVTYTGKTSNSFTGVTRARDGTVAVTHAVGETISIRVTAGLLNADRAAILALELKVGIGSSLPANGSIFGGTGPNASAWFVPGLSNVVAWLGFTPVNKAGDTMTGLLVLSGDPSAALGAVTKQYVDAHAGVTSFNSRNGIVSLISNDVTTALGYTPSQTLTFIGALNINGSNQVSCPTCEVVSNRNIANGYTGLDSNAKIPVSLGQEVWSVADLTEYSGSSGTGATAIRATITSPNINDVLTWNGTNWINQAGGGGGGGYNTIAEEGSSITQRSVLNFIGSAITAADSGAVSNVTLSQSPAGSASVVGIGRQLLNGTGITGGGDLSADRTLAVVADTTNQQLQFLNNAASLVGTRHSLQLLAGGALSWTMTDDSANNRMDVTPVLSTSPGSAATLVGTGRLMNTTSPILGGGDLSADRTISLAGLSGLGTANQIVGMNAGATAYEYKTVNGTSNQITVTQAANSITFALPQDYATSSTPTLAGLNVTGLTGLVIGSGTAISGTTAFDFLVSSAGTKPRLRYLSTGTGTGKWQFSNDGVGFTDLPTGGTGITSLNALTGATQTFAVGTTGSDFNISSSGTVHNFNIPDASASNRGLVTTGTQTFAGAKTFGSVTATRVVQTEVTLTDAATINTDCSTGSRFRVTLAGNRTLANPTNANDGQQIVWEFIQDATGSRTITLGTKFALGTDITAITLTTTANKRDFMTAVYNSTADKFYIQGFVKGY